MSISKPQIRAYLRWTMIVALPVSIYLLHQWLAANNAGVSDQSITYLTAILVFITYLQWDVMAVQNDAIERQLEQMRLDQRPWLCVAKAAEFVGGPPTAGQILDLMVPVKNSGNTPGKINYAGNGIFIALPDEDIRPQIAEIEATVRDAPRASVVPPGAQIQFQKKAPEPIPQAAVDGINSGDVLLYVYSVIYYVDGWNNEHITRQCFVYNPENKILRGHTQHNEAT